jgi:hypothetical protein
MRRARPHESTLIVADGWQVEQLCSAATAQELKVQAWAMFACHRPRPYDLQVKPNTTTHCRMPFFETLSNLGSRRSPRAMSAPGSDLAGRPRTLPTPVVRAGVAAGSEQTPSAGG